MNPSLSNRPPPGGSTPDPGEKWVLAHLSDPHVAFAGPVGWRDLRGKRILGRLRWYLYRRIGCNEEILSLLREDLAAREVDHTVVTGDLTHLSLPAEFEKVRVWLRSLGPPSRVTVLPGNHDAYVPVPWDQALGTWWDYMRSDPEFREAEKPRGPEDLFPILRVRGRLALVGVSTARPSAPWLAVGSVGKGQMERLERDLARLAERRLFRVLLIHHPPLPGLVGWRKRLTDAEDLLRVLERVGVELILHGHAHKCSLRFLEVPGGRIPIPVLGAASISSTGRVAEHAASYFLVSVAAAGTAGWDLTVSQRIYSRSAGGFVPGWSRRLPVGGEPG